MNCSMSDRQVRWRTVRPVGGAGLLQGRGRVGRAHGRSRGHRPA